MCEEVAKIECEEPLTFVLASARHSRSLRENHRATSLKVVCETNSNKSSPLLEDSMDQTPVTVKRVADSKVSANELTPLALNCSFDDSVQPRSKSCRNLSTHKHYRELTYAKLPAQTSSRQLE